MAEQYLQQLLQENPDGDEINLDMRDIESVDELIPLIAQFHNVSKVGPLMAVEPGGEPNTDTTARSFMSNVDRGVKFKRQRFREPRVHNSQHHHHSPAEVNPPEPARGGASGLHIQDDAQPPVFE